MHLNTCTWPLIIFIINCLIVFVALLPVLSVSAARDYYYTRTREHPRHLRISEEFKNQYVGDVKYERVINGTNYEYYRSNRAAAGRGGRSANKNYDELVFEIIDKIFRHRLSPFYIHHYDNDHDKRQSSDPRLVSPEACARDLMYLVDKLPLMSSTSGQHKPQRAAASGNPFKPEPEGGYEDTDEDYLTPELTAFFDSYARPEAGLLMGNTFWVGAYDQCVNRHVFELIDSPHHNRKSSSSASTSNSQQQQQQQQAISFKGRYCVASLRAPIWDRLIERKIREEKNYFKSERQIGDYSKLFRLQMGICLPDSCDSTALERHYDEIKLLTSGLTSSSSSGDNSQHTAPNLNSRFQDYNLINLYCLPDETSPLRQWSQSAVNFILFLTCWLCSILMATLADIFEVFPIEKSREEEEEEKEKGEKVEKKVKRKILPQLVQWFSLRANYRKLMHVSSSTRAGSTSTNTKNTTTTTQQQQPEKIHVDLKFLNAFKAAIMFWIINGHIMLLMIQTAKNILDSDALLNKLMHFLIGATFGVDLFFTMTGFLTTYLMFNSGHAYKMRPTTWLYLSFHRYWRLAPMYLLSFWFSRSVMQSLGSGPLWDYGTSSITFRGLCNTESWWYPLTLTSNLHGLFEECMITSWYISCDMQFWLVSPVFIYLLAKSPLSGWLVSIGTIIASSQLRYDSVLNDKSARYDELVKPRADIFMRVSHDMPALYTHPHYRISAYVVGLLAGHYVYMIQSGKWSSVMALNLAREQSLEAKDVRDVDVDSEDVRDQSLDQSVDKTKTTKVATGAGDNLVDDNNDADKMNLNDNKIENNANDDDDDVTMAKNKQQCAHSNATRGRILRSLLAYVGIVLLLTMANASYLLSHYYPSSLLHHSKLVAAWLYSLDHLAMSLGAAFVIIAMCMGQWRHNNNGGGGVQKFLAHPNWTRLSKINYALLLLQCEAIYFQIFRYEQVPMAGTRELINILFNLLVTLYPLAFAVTLVFEYPLANVEKLLLGGI